MGKGKALDSNKYFMIIANMIDNGQSASANNPAGAVQQVALSERYSLRHPHEQTRGALKLRSRAPPGQFPTHTIEVPSGEHE